MKIIPETRPPRNGLLATSLLRSLRPSSPIPHRWCQLRSHHVPVSPNSTLTSVCILADEACPGWTLGVADVVPVSVPDESTLAEAPRLPLDLRGILLPSTERQTDTLGVIVVAVKAPDCFRCRLSAVVAGCWWSIQRNKTDHLLLGSPLINH